MKICVRGYKLLEIPNALAVQEKGPFDGHTPYVAKLTTRLKQKAYLEKKLPSKLLCLESIIERTKELGSYSSFCEPMAGVGLSARLFDVGGPLHLNDLDETCRKILKLNFKAKPTAHDIMKTEFPTVDTLFLDFNDFTYKRYMDTAYGEVLARAFASTQKFVVLNDCSIFYFRYGETSYDAYSKRLGMSIKTPRDYFRAFAKVVRQKHKPWSMTHVAYFRDTAFILFSRGESQLTVEEIHAVPIVSVLPESL